MEKQQDSIMNYNSTKKQQHYSIRKYTCGVASIALGATLFLGIGHEVQASESEEKVQDVSTESLITSDINNENETTEVIEANDKEVEETPIVNEESISTGQTVPTVEEENIDKSIVNTEVTDKNIEQPIVNENKNEEIVSPHKRLARAATNDQAAVATTEATTDIDFKVKKEKTDDNSVMDGYMEKPAKVSYKEGKSYIDLKLKSPRWWKAFELYNGSEKLNLTTVSESENEKTVQTQVPAGIKELIAKVHIVVPMMNYDNHYTTRLVFDKAIPKAPVKVVDDKKIKEELAKKKKERKAIDDAFLLEDKIKELKKVLRVTNESTKAEYQQELKAVEQKLKEEKARAVTGFEQAESKQVDLSNAKTHNIVLKHGTKDTKSSMDSYIIRPAKSVSYNGMKYLVVTLKDKRIWKDIRVEGDNGYSYPIVINDDATKKEKTIMFPLKAGKTIYNAIMKFQISMGGKSTYDGAYKFRFEDLGEVQETTEPKVDEKPKPEKTSEKESNTKTDSKIIEAIKNQKIHDKEITDERRPINFEVINPKTNREYFYYASMIKSPANIIFGDKEATVEFSVSAPSTWVEFDLFDGDNKLDYEVVSYDTKKGRVLLRVKVKNNTEQINVKGTSEAFGVTTKYDVGNIKFERPIVNDKNQFITKDEYNQQKDREKYDQAITLEDKIRENKKLRSKVDANAERQLDIELAQLEEQLKEQLKEAEEQYQNATVQPVDLTNATKREVRVLHSKRDEDSHMNFEVKRPTKVVNVNGKKYLVMTLENDAAWKDFLIEGPEGYKHPTTIDKNVEKNERTIIFPLEEGKEFYNAIVKLKIKTENIDYEGAYHVRIKDLGDVAENDAKAPITDKDETTNHVDKQEDTQKPEEGKKDNVTLANKEEEPSKEETKAPSKLDKEQKSEVTPVDNVQKLPELTKSDNVSIADSSKDAVVQTTKQVNPSNNKVESKQVYYTPANNNKRNTTSSNQAQPKEKTLPNTGEAETTHSTLIGSLLAMAGAMLLIRRRKAEKKAK